MFSSGFFDIFNNNYFQEHLRVAASERNYQIRTQGIII